MEDLRGCLSAQRLLESRPIGDQFRRMTCPILLRRTWHQLFIASILAVWSYIADMIYQLRSLKSQATILISIESVYYQINEQER
jgi:hypothetical protein